jgi:cell division protein ZapA
MSQTLDIKLLDKDYRVACTPEERESLSAAVAFLADRLKEISDKTRGTPERVAVMAALNLAHEFLALKNNLPPDESSLENPSLWRMMKLTEAKLDESLARFE